MKKKDMVKINSTTYKKEAFLIEEYHPAIGRILIVEGIKFKILDDYNIAGGHKSGTFLKRFTERDQEVIDEYEKDIEELSEKLKERLDLKKLIKEKLKGKDMQDIKTGLYILREQEKGKKVEEEHIKGCYNYKVHLGQQTFEFIDGGTEEAFLDSRRR